MTIRDIVLNQPTQGINEWLLFIDQSKLQKYEQLILNCAEHYNKITINHKASFNTKKILTNL